MKGQRRMAEACDDLSISRSEYRDCLPSNCPSHADVPYAFKAYALEEISQKFSTLLWLDASVVPIRPLDGLFEKIESDGYWICRNGWSNYTWTADEAYPLLFPGIELNNARELNKTIPHVVATAFGISVAHPIGLAILDEYMALAKNGAFRGPWWNSNSPEDCHKQRAAPCGPPDVRGHRHDQTALSVIAARNLCVLTNAPKYFAYIGGETEETVLVAQGI